MKPYVVIEKKVGETPLAALEKYRAEHQEFAGVPAAYGGRLDPMASGKLLLLFGDECKRQEKYHALDKEYEFQVLFGVSSDTGDVLGRLSWERDAPEVAYGDLRRIARNLIGPITLPYPHFSSKTVRGKPPHLSSDSQRRAKRNPRKGVGGKPLHVWTLENRLNEIEIPTYSAHIYKLKLINLEYKTGTELTDEALAKIETIPKVTDESKALGRDFRRTDVRADWQRFKDEHAGERFALAGFTCTCSSGLYMRSLAEVIAQKMGTTGLAYSISRTKIGRYHRFLGLPYWKSPGSHS